MPDLNIPISFNKTKFYDKRFGLRLSKIGRDGKLRHSVDAQVWKHFDAKHSNFARETRKIRLRLASDGFYPFRCTSLSHPTWSVVLTIY